MKTTTPTLTPDPPPGSESAGVPSRRTATGWIGLVVLAMVVVFSGAFVGLFGPLLAISCTTCQDGVRNPRFGDALIAVAHYAVPIATFGTVVATFIARRGARAATIGLGVLMILLFLMLGLGQAEKGPKDQFGYTPTVKSIADASHETRKISTKILNIIDLDGKVTEPGPNISTCGNPADRFFVVRHPWSLYGVPVGEMRGAMDRLSKELPKHGWKVVSYGPNNSKAKSLELRVESTKKKTAVRVTLQDRRGRSEAPSLIEVSVVSDCYEKPANEPST